MPLADEILGDLQFIVQEAWAVSPVVRLPLLALVAASLVKGRVLTAFLSTFVALICITTAALNVVFEENANLPLFAVFFALGVVWGREALLLPADFKPRYRHLAAAAIFGGCAFFYPHFVDGVRGAILFAPLGMVPAATLLAATAAVALCPRSFTLLAVVPTWTAGALLAAAGVFFLGVKVDFLLIAAVTASIAIYFSTPAPREAKRRRVKRKRR